MNPADQRPRFRPRYRGTREELAEIDAAFMYVCRDERPKKTTIRHVFYRAVGKGVVPKTDKADKTKEWRGRTAPSGSDLVERRIKELRDNGTLPYEWIADTSRTRTTTGGGSRHLGDTLDDIPHYRDMWANQPRYVEVWIGKESIDSVVSDILARWDVGITPTSGFSSITQKYDVAREIERRAAGRPVTILWIDDCDPSAETGYESIKRDLKKWAPNVKFTFVQVAISKKQRDNRNRRFRGRRYELQTRPTKDSTHGTTEEFGPSIEVDAMPSDVLRGLLADGLAELIDHDAWEEMLAVQEREQERLNRGVADLRDELHAEGWF
jgi:hypothetical protein